MKNFWYSKWFWISVVAVVALGGGMYYSTHKTVSVETATVERKTIIQEVIVTGRTKPVESVELSFEGSGRITYVPKKVGDHVFTGEVLAAQNTVEIGAQINEAEAAVASAEAKLEELKRGTRPEEVAIQEIQVENARIALSNAKQNAIATLRDAYTKTDDAIRNKVDQFLSSPRSSSPQLNFTSFNASAAASLLGTRPAMESMLISWNSSISSLSIDSNVLAATLEAKSNLATAAAFLDTASLVVNTLIPSSSLTQTTIDGYKADVSTGRTNIAAAYTSISSTEDKLRTAESNVKLEESELALKKAGTVSDQIHAQEAAVLQAEARVSTLVAQRANSTLVSPISGIVTVQNAKVGEIAPAQKTIVAVISDAKFEIETNVPEVDIGKLKIGDTATVTLDAYGNDVIFNAVVTKIDPAETVIEGVSTYTTTLQFSQADSRIRSGMTANIDIEVARSEHALAIPERFLKESNGKRTVLVQSGDAAAEKEVTVGLRGSDGMIEILSGLSEGESVRLPAE